MKCYKYKKKINILINISKNNKKFISILAIFILKIIASKKVIIIPANKNIIK